MMAGCITGNTIRRPDRCHSGRHIYLSLGRMEGDMKSMLFWLAVVLAAGLYTASSGWAQSGSSGASARKLMSQLRGIDDDKGYLVALQLSEIGRDVMPYLI